MWNSTKARLKELDLDVYAVDSIGTGDKRVEWVTTWPKIGHFSIHTNAGEVGAWDSVGDALEATVTKISEFTGRCVDNLSDTVIISLFNLKGPDLPWRIAAVYTLSALDVFAILCPEGLLSTEENVPA